MHVEYILFRGILANLKEFWDMVHNFNIWYLIQAFWWMLLHDFDVGLLVRVCYANRSSTPYANFLTDPINIALIWKSRSNYCMWTYISPTLTEYEILTKWQVKSDWCCIFEIVMTLIILKQCVERFWLFVLCHIAT